MKKKPNEKKKKKKQENGEEKEKEEEEEKEEEGPSVLISKYVGKEAPGISDRVVHDVHVGCK